MRCSLCDRRRTLRHSLVISTPPGHSLRCEQCGVRLAKRSVPRRTRAGVALLSFGAAGALGACLSGTLPAWAAALSLVVVSAGWLFEARFVEVERARLA
ncbi:MAG TPA: hypothetical protein VFS43_29655 [Polyangiaceae bacterium]|nr:hypothetical protein [Polyangiaceae bacterium]